MQGIKPLTKIMMLLSSVGGVTFFTFANIIHLIVLPPVHAAYVQFTINACVFLAWGKAYLECEGKHKNKLLVCALVPVGMASITLVHVFLIPAYFHG